MRAPFTPCAKSCACPRPALHQTLFQPCLPPAAAADGAFVATQSQLLGIYGCLLVIAGLVNTYGNKLLAILNGISVFWHVAGTFAFIIALLAVAPTHMSASYVFTQFNNGRSEQAVKLVATSSSAYALLPTASAAGSGVGISNNFYVFALGLLMSQFTLTG